MYLSFSAWLYNQCNTNEPLTSILSSYNLEPRQLLRARTDECRYLAQAAVVDFKLLEVMTLEAQTEDQKLQKKNSIADCWEGLFFLSCLIQRICPVGCVVMFVSRVLPVPSGVSLLHFFWCVLQALSSQTTEVNWISENKQNRMCSTLNLLSFCCLSQKLCPLMLTGFLIQKIILPEWYYLWGYI